MTNEPVDSTTDTDGDYEASNITVLEGLEGVRERPGMYIGSTDSKGLHHLVDEVVDNSIDEALAGHCDEISVTVHNENKITVADNGRGIPIQQHDEHDAPAVEVIMTVLHAGGKFDSDSYKVSGGLHGVGVSAVNALSEELEVVVKRNGGVYHHEFAKGIPQKDLEKIRDMEPDEDTGTEITFKPDTSIFEVTTYDSEKLADRLRELAFLNSGISISLTDERDSTDEDTRDTYEFYYEGGIREFVEYLNEGKDEIHDDVIYITDEGEATGGGTVEVEIGIQITDSVQESIHSFANNIKTHDGGKHLTGFKSALTRIYNSYASENGMLDDIDGNLSGNDVRDGMTAVISIKHPDPQFEGQTKTTLGNSEVRSIVEGAIHDAFDELFEENPSTADTLVSHAVAAAQARQKAEKAEELARRKDSLSTTRLPGKLTDCQSQDPTDTELFIVEGDSAGGSAKQGRDNETQAILPIKGKIINVEKHRLDRVLENDEIQAIVEAIGTGIGKEFDISDIRYNSIIIMTDADVDGAHIRTLLLTFFYRHMKPLLENGHVYAAQPPLYRVKNKGETFDVMTEEERDAVIKEHCNGSPTQVQRFKGLGEMNPKQLWDTTMHHNNRKLKRITVSDAAKADKMFSLLMGDEVKPRREFIIENSDDTTFIDI